MTWVVLGIGLALAIFGAVAGTALVSLSRLELTRVVAGQLRGGAGSLSWLAEMEQYLTDAGLETVDVWMERRLRRTSAEAYLERMRVVASHITSGILSDDEVAALMERIAAGTQAVSGPRGFEYTFTKLYAVARKPER